MCVWGGGVILLSSILWKQFLHQHSSSYGGLNKKADNLRKHKIKQIPKIFLIFKKKQENDGVDDISSLFQRHCQTNRLDYKQAVLYIYEVQSWQAVVSQSGEEH